MKNKYFITSFLATFIFSFLFVGLIFISVVFPSVRRYFGFLSLLVFVSLALLSAILLIVFSIKSNFSKKVKTFSILMGGSFVLFIASVVLHNLFYGIGVKSLEIFFFIIAVFICPFLFFGGFIGSIYFLLKDNF